MYSHLATASLATLLLISCAKLSGPSESPMGSSTTGGSRGIRNGTPAPDDSGQGFTVNGIGLLRVQLSGGISVCTMALISPTRALTAAHCVSGSSNRPLPASALSVSFALEPDISNPAGFIPVSQVVRHPRYLPLNGSLYRGTGGADVAILKFSTAFSKPVYPMFQYGVAPGIPISILGYGQSFTEDTSLIRREGTALFEAYSTAFLRGGGAPKGASHLSGLKGAGARELV